MISHAKAFPDTRFPTEFSKNPICGESAQPFCLTSSLRTPRKADSETKVDQSVSVGYMIPAKERDRRNTPTEKGAVRQAPLGFSFG